MIRRSGLLVALLLVGCGTVGELLGDLTTDGGTDAEPPDSRVDAWLDANVPDEADSPYDADASDVDLDAPSGDTMREAPDTGPPALGQGPFGPVSVVGVVSNPGWVNEDPSLTEDQLELYFASSQLGSESIWVSHRPTATDPWGTPSTVTELGGSVNEPCVAGDGLTIWFAQLLNTDAQLRQKIWVSSRAARTDPWAPPRAVTELAAPGFDDEKPSVDQAELVMVFMSNRPGGAGGLDIYMSTRPTTADPWGVPVNVREVNTPGDERDPFLGGNDLQLFWAANPPMEQIRWASRPSVNAPFSSFQSLSELGGPDFDPALSVDLHHILFASQRPGDQHQQIYEAFR